MIVSVYLTISHLRASFFFHQVYFLNLTNRKFTFLEFNPSELKISSTLLSEHVAKTGICFISSSFTK